MAEYDNILDNITARAEFRAWLEEHAQTERECYVVVKRGNPVNCSGILPYLDAVEEALCFGWIDSTVRPIGEKRYQRFSPRRSGSNWTELNKERVRRLERLGLMTDAGRAALPREMDASHFVVDAEIEEALREAGAWDKFCAMPALYQRVRSSNLVAKKGYDPAGYGKSLARFVGETRKGRMYGDWDDYGRLG